MTFSEAMVEAEVEAACDRLELDLTTRVVIVGDHFWAGMAVMSRCVIKAAMIRDLSYPDLPDRVATEIGADDYVRLFMAIRSDGPPDLPGDEFDWHGALIQACSALDLAAGDRAYVLAELARQGWRSVALWAEASAPQPRPCSGVMARLGCRYFALAALWLREYRPDSLPLSIYAVAG